MRHERLGVGEEGGHGRDADEIRAAPEANELARQVLNIMEQGVIVWGPDGRCILHNSRVYQMLEIGVDDLHVGTARAEFRERSIRRGEMTRDLLTATEQLIKSNQPYSFDRYLPSGRVVLTHGRPTRGGGTVVTFTDVTEARRAARDLAEAKAAAERAQAQAMEVLEQERARQTEARMLAQLDEWLQSCKSLDELYMIVQRFMATLLPGSKGELYIYSNSRDVLDGMCNWNTRDLHDTITADACWALRRGRHYVYETGGLCFHCDHVTAHRHEVPVDEYICIPIVAHGDTVGLLHVRFDCSREDTARIAGKGEFTLRCGEHISMAIANAKLRDELRDQSIRDPLTGLFNRRYFLDSMRREIAVAERRGGTLGLITFDADRFKTFNDTHGHDAGDMVLRAIGGRLTDLCTGGEIPCRFGGEEFAILVPGAGREGTLALGERLRETIAATQVRYLDAVLPRVTISAGIAVWPDHGTEPATLLRRADAALYRAKEEGRDRVVFATAG